MLGPEKAYSFFKDTIVPHSVLKFQERRDNIPSYCTDDTGEPIIVNVIMKCIKEYEFSKAQVRVMQSSAFRGHLLVYNDLHWKLLVQIAQCITSP